MHPLFSRVLAAVLAAVGAFCAVTGVWFMSQLGSDGTATFTAEPGSQTVVLPPDVLNRVDADVTVEVTAEGPVWLGLARPSDADSVMQDAAAARATGVSVRSWELETTTGGSETAAPASYDLWQGRSSGEGTATITVRQDAAPQTLVVTAAEGQQVETVTMSMSDSGWFTRAALLTILGVALLAAAAYLALRGRRRESDEDDQRDETVEDGRAADEERTVPEVDETKETTR